MSDELKVAIEAAKAGAREALKHFNKDLKMVNWKGKEWTINDHS